MHNEFVVDARLYEHLYQLDRTLASQCQQADCRYCRGPLHNAPYPRKPRGAPKQLSDARRARFSFCCAACRKRTTPASLRFLGRRVYLAAVLVLCGKAPLSGARIALLHQALRVDRRTLERWRRWWREELPLTAFWQRSRPYLVPPVDTQLLPASLLERFHGTLSEPLVAMLRFVSPLSGHGC
jgi:hypothetical protein